MRVLGAEALVDVFELVLEIGVHGSAGDQENGGEDAGITATRSH